MMGCVVDTSSLIISWNLSAQDSIVLKQWFICIEELIP
jgi:hypothetical protein